ncbi:MAG: hypothetical protein ACLT8E_06750 [Akkermansia sp.]
MAGRLLAIRDMGKSQFFVIGDDVAKSRGSCTGMKRMKPPEASSWTAGTDRHCRSTFLTVPENPP